MPSLRCSARISLRISARSCASRFDSGSSIRQTGASLMIARPSATRCCWPPESCDGLRASSCDRPSSSETRASRRSRSAAPTSRTRSPKTMFSATERCGNSAYDWNTIAMFRCLGGSVVTSRPAIPIVPASACLQAGDQPQRRRLAAPRGPEQHVERARLEREGKIVDRVHDAVRRRPVLADSTQCDRGHVGFGDRRRIGAVRGGRSARG